MACVTYPEMDCSISVPRLVLVVVPQVPDCSPVPISSIARFVLYVDAMIFSLALPVCYQTKVGLCGSDTRQTASLPRPVCFQT